MLDTVQTLLVSNKPADVDAALACATAEGTLTDTITNATATIGEKISLRRIAVVEKADDEFFGSYVHMGGKISALVTLKGKADEKVAKDIAMQVASMAPQYVSRDEMPADVVEHERKVQTEIVKNDEKLANKPEKVLEGIKRGKLNKVFSEWCLLDQEFIKTPKESVAKYLGKAKVLEMARFQVGEGIEKKEENFAEEVAAQMKQ